MLGLRAAVARAVRRFVGAIAPEVRLALAAGARLEESLRHIREEVARQRGAMDQALSQLRLSQQREIQVLREQQLVTLHSLQRVTASALSPRLCVLSCMPPAQSGIASSTLLAYSGAEYPVDIFAEYDSMIEYLDALSDERIVKSQVELFHLSAWPVASSQRSYIAQVFTLGNSAHNTSTLQCLRLPRHLPPRSPIVIHLHDPCLLGLVRDLCLREQRDFLAWMRSVYTLAPDIDGSDDSLIGAGALGIRAALSGMPVAAIVVHSEAARQHVEREVPGARTYVIPHPKDRRIKGRAPKPKGVLTIGSFGYLHVEKRTEVILGAFEIVRHEVPDAQLTLAGYNAGQYGILHSLADVPGVTVVDAPGDRSLFQLMESVDFAVQLRRRNLGETSGIVSQLLAADVPVIVSRLGSFEEYGDLVDFVEPGCSEADLAAAILTKWRSGTRSTHVAQYPTERSFSDQLMQVLLDGHSQAGV